MISQEHIGLHVLLVDKESIDYISPRLRAFISATSALDDHSLNLIGLWLWLRASLDTRPRSRSYVTKGSSRRPGGELLALAKATGLVVCIIQSVYTLEILLETYENAVGESYNFLGASSLLLFLSFDN